MHNFIKIALLLNKLDVTVALIKRNYKRNKMHNFDDLGLLNSQSDA